MCWLHSYIILFLFYSMCWLHSYIILFLFYSMCWLHSYIILFLFYSMCWLHSYIILFLFYSMCWLHSYIILFLSYSMCWLQTAHSLQYCMLTKALIMKLMNGTQDPLTLMITLMDGHLLVRLTIKFIGNSHSHCTFNLLFCHNLSTNMLIYIHVHVRICIFDALSTGT